MSLLKATFNM